MLYILDIYILDSAKWWARACIGLVSDARGLTWAIHSGGIYFTLLVLGILSEVVACTCSRVRVRVRGALELTSSCRGAIGELPLFTFIVNSH